MSYAVTSKPNNPRYDCSADFANTAFDKGYAYIIRKNGANYEAINGATGRLVYGGASDEGAVDGADAAAVLVAVLAAATTGAVLLRETEFDLTQFGDIPEDVRVICSYNAECWEYINSADSSGSPYTVSVGSGVNAGYYLAQDSEGRICYASTSWGTLLNAVIAGCSSGETVQVQDGSYSASASVSITMKSGVNVVGESREGVQFTSTGNIIFRFNGVANATLANCYISHAGGTNIMSVYIYGTTPNYNTVSNIHFSGTATWAITVSSATGLTVKNCVMNTANIPNFLYVSGTLTQSKIVGNAVYDCQTGGIAVYVRNIVSSEITNNLFVNAVKSSNVGAITVSNVGGTSENFWISENIIRFTSDPPVVVNGILVRGESSSNLTSGFTVSNNKIHISTDVTENVNVGVYLLGYSSGARTVQHGVVCGNTVTGAGFLNYGLIGAQSQYNTYTGNSVYNAIISGAHFDAATSYSVLSQNTFLVCAVGASNLGGATNILRDNVGYVTENSGTGSITSGSTSDVITHGCSYTPAAADIVITLTENPTNTPGAIWVDTIGPAEFTVNCENDPGASNLDFSWAVRKV